MKQGRKCSLIQSANVYIKYGCGQKEKIKKSSNTKQFHLIVSYFFHNIININRNVKNSGSGPGNSTQDAGICDG
jgi:hypothetical protein